MPKLERRRKVVAVVFALFAVFLVAVFVSDLKEASLMSRIANGEEISDAAASANDNRQALFGGLETIFYIVTIIIFLRWIYYAYKHLDADLRRWEPGWAIGGWFVPVLALWRPKQIVNDLWNAGGSPPPSPLLTAWWTSWLVAGLIGNFAFRRTFNGDTPEELRDAATASCVADVLFFISTIFAVLMVRAVTRRLLATRGVVAASAWTSPERPQGLAI